MHEKKNTTITLSVSPEYVSGWGFWESLREFIQNGLDAHDEGFPLSVERGGGKSKAIKIRSEGASLGRETLLLGTSGKRSSSSARGGFGEGYKLAALVLTRSGYGVQIRTPAEYWDFTLAHSAEFGAETLQVKVRPAPPADYVEVRVTAPDHHADIDWDLAWSRVLERLLDVPGVPGTQVDASKVTTVASGNRILRDPRYAGALFCRGLFVGRLPDAAHAWGYDLKIGLDRDRKMADPWELRHRIAETLQAACVEGLVPVADLYALMQGASAEANALASNTWAVGTLSQRFADYFREKHGEDAVPVVSFAEAEALEHVALRPVSVTRHAQQVLEAALGPSAQAVARRKTEARAQVSLGDLDATERSNLSRAVDVVQRALVAEGHEDFVVGERLSVVEFHGDTMLGIYDQGQIRIARKVLADVVETLATIAHEVAHHYDGGDNGRHNRFTERLLARGVARFLTLS